MTFEGKTALVTGASRGIGRAVAVAWSRAGGDVALVARDPKRLEAVASGIEHGRVEAFALDLRDGSALAGLPGRVLAAFGRIDALVHAAGVWGTVPDSPETCAEADEIWQLNLRVPVALSDACLGPLRESAGEIVFVNSSAVRDPTGTPNAYVASKQALAASADRLRARVNAEGIRVLSLHPGRTATAMQRRIFELEGRTWRPELLLQPEDVASVALHAMSLPRTAEVTEIHIRPFRKSY